MRWFILVLAFVVAEPPKPGPPESGSEGIKAPATEAREKGATPEAAKPRGKPEGKPKLKKVVVKLDAPAVGGRAVLSSRDEKGEEFAIWATKTANMFREYVKALVMDDEKRMDQLEDEGKAVVLDEETSVQIVGLEPYVVNAGDRGTDGTCAAVLVLDGPHKGETLLTEAENLAQVRYVPEAAGAVRKGRKGTARKGHAAKKSAPAKTPARSPESRAATLLRLGQGLEKSGKTGGALDLYRQVVKQYPKTPQAGSAAERIKALEAK